MPIASEQVEAFVTLDELERLYREQPSNYLVEGLLPADDVHVAVGDSGLGKTPWAYQLGLCVASGQPFLDHAVRPSKVLYYDMENGSDDILKVGRDLCGYLRIDHFPPDFLVLPNEGNPPDPELAVERYRPGLVIIDTLRALRPEAEASNDRMGYFLQQLRSTARTHHSAILLLHHVRKPGELGASRLETTPTLEWLLQAAGARSLINQTNARIAFDRPGSKGREDAALVMRSFVKMKGESGPLYLERVSDTDGEPIGYHRISGLGLLGNPEQENAFGRLPKRFTFKDAKFAYGKTDNPTTEFLKKCESAGLLTKVARGVYEKV
jgi:hypothetical protein